MVRKYNVFQHEEPIQVSISEQVQDPLLSIHDICKKYKMSVIEDDRGVRFAKGYIHVPDEQMRGEGPIIRGMYRYNPAKPFRTVPAYAKCTHNQKVNDNIITPNVEVDLTCMNPGEISPELDTKWAHLESGHEIPIETPNIDIKWAHLEPSQEIPATTPYKEGDPPPDESLMQLQQQLKEIRELLLKAQVSHFKDRRKRKVVRKFEPSDDEDSEEIWHQRVGHQTGLTETLKAGALRG
jgi:hypothetical protein